MDLKGVCTIRSEAPRDGIRALNEMLQHADTRSDPGRQSYVLYTLAALYSSIGEVDNAVASIDGAYKIAAANSLTEVMQLLEETVATVHLHRALAAAGQQDLLVPMRADGLHARPEDVATAIAHLKKAAEAEPDNAETAWLLNLANMVAGTYPANVPAQFVLPQSVFSSLDNVGHFPDVAHAAGLDVRGTAGGVIIDDFDNDGLLDVVASQVDDCQPLRFFHNNGDGTFSDRTAQAGLQDQTGGLNLIQADYNNDGCTDILVLRGGWEYPRRRSLLRNNCDGTFTDVTAQSGLLEPIRSSQTAVWTDIDNDGWLDLFIANENAPSQLFLNRRDGTFQDISQKAGIDKQAFSKGVVAADYDNDGYPDFYVSNFNGSNFLYHNKGDRTFTEIAEYAGVAGPWMSFAAGFLDYDNDGWPDLFVTSYFMSVEESIHSYTGKPRNAETLKLYRNMRNGMFRDVTAEVGLDRVFMPMGFNFGDVDNDGYLDLYMGMGNPSFASLLPNTLLRNQEGKKFVDITGSSGTGAFSKGHGVAMADLRNSGNEDIYVVMGGPDAGDRNASRLFANPGGHENDWISLKLTGVRSNRSAIGARITITETDAVHGARQICRTVSSGGSFGASPLEQHIGLGKSAHISKIEVWWPTSGTHQVFTNIKPNQFLEIRESDTQPRPLKRRSFHFSGETTAAAVK